MQLFEGIFFLTCRHAAIVAPPTQKSQLMEPVFIIHADSLSNIQKSCHSRNQRLVMRYLISWATHVAFLITVMLMGQHQYWSFTSKENVPLSFVTQVYCPLWFKNLSAPGSQIECPPLLRTRPPQRRRIQSSGSVRKLPCTWQRNRLVNANPESLTVRVAIDLSPRSISENLISCQGGGLSERQRIRGPSSDPLDDQYLKTASKPPWDGPIKVIASAVCWNEAPPACSVCLCLSAFESME